jgi:hypothetical protein
MSETDRPLRYWEDDGWMLLSDADADKHVPKDTERWLESDLVVDVGACR